MLRVEVTPRAAAQIASAATWWAENRLAAPDAIRLDLEDALSLLARQPGIGARSRSSRYPDLRRLATKDKQALARSVAPLIALPVRRVIVAHDQIIDEQPVAKLKQAFAWLR